MDTEKTKIIQLITKLVDDTFRELELVKSQILSENKKLVFLTIEYANLSKEISSSRDEINKEASELKRNVDSFENDKLSFGAEVSKFNENKSNIEAELKSKVSSRTAIEKEIESSTKRLKTLDTQVKAKETIAQELESITKLTTEKKTEFETLKIDYENTKKAMDKLRIDTKNELQYINDDIEARRKVVFPTIQALDEREKSVAQKEKGINTIIERYKKLYADKGAGFMV